MFQPGRSVWAILLWLAVLPIRQGPPPADPGPTLWISDQWGQLGTVNVQTGQVTIRGEMVTPMDDIAFDPEGHLFGVGRGVLYTIDPADGTSQPIGELGVQVNSLVFDASGTLLAASDELYRLDPSTGRAQLLGSGGIPYSSSGDLAFVNGLLTLSSTSPDSPDDILVLLDPTSGWGTALGSIGYPEVLGLATNDNQHLFGISGTQILAIDPATGAGRLLLDYAGQGLGRAYGSAFTQEAAQPPISQRISPWRFGLGALVLSAGMGRVGPPETAVQ